MNSFKCKSTHQSHVASLPKYPKPPLEVFGGHFADI